jgi:hypothetical protein
MTIPSRTGTVHEAWILDHAHAALADDRERRVVAEVRDVHARGAARLEGV